MGEAQLVGTEEVAEAAVMEVREAMVAPREAPAVRDRQSRQ